MQKAALAEAQRKEVQLKASETLIMITAAFSPCGNEERLDSLQTSHTKWSAKLC